MVVFTLMLLDVETESENWIFLKYGRTLCNSYEVLPYLVILCPISHSTLTVEYGPMYQSYSTEYIYTYSYCHCQDSVRRTDIYIGGMQIVQNVIVYIV